MNEFEKGLFAEPYIHYASFEEGYNKAIDDFAELIRNRIEIGCMFTVTEIDKWAEQLKAGREK